MIIYSSYPFQQAHSAPVVHEDEEEGPKCRHAQAGRNSYSGLLKCKLKLTSGKLGQQGSRQQERNNKRNQPSMM